MAAVSKGAGQRSGAAAQREALPSREAFPVEAYLARYQGFTKISRATFIAQQNAELAPIAWRVALLELKNTLSTELMASTLSQARAACGEGVSEYVPQEDEWLKRTNRTYTDRLQKLEGDLSQRMREAVKDRIRSGNLALAELAMQRGDFVNAVARFLEARDQSDPQSRRQFVECCVGALKASLLMGSTMNAKSHAERALSAGGELARAPVLHGQVLAGLGLAELRRGNLAAAADCFSRAPFDVEGHFRDIIVGEDIALYAALCAVSTLERRTIKNQFLDNENFKKFLELSPTASQLLHSFLNCQYGVMLQVLATNERDLRLDMHLSPHVATLMRRLNEVAVLQYFKPYVAVSIPRMAESLALEPQVLEQQLVQLIANGRLQAQIDAQSRVLRARNTDERSVTFQDAIAAAAQHIRDTKSLLHRMQLIKHKFDKQSRKVRQAGGELSSLVEDDAAPAADMFKGMRSGFLREAKRPDA